VSTDPSVQKARKLRLRHRRERQAVVFGVLIAAMAVMGLVAVAVYSGTIAPPISVSFASDKGTPDAATTPPCLPTKGKTTPVPYKKIKINVYNASQHRGIAAAASNTLQERGFTILSTGNSKAPVNGVRISFGKKGVTRAYTLSAHFTDPVLYYDARKDATIDVTLGQNYDGLVKNDDVTLDADTPMENLPGCSPVDQLVPAAAPVAKKDDAQS